MPALTASSPGHYFPVFHSLPVDKNEDYIIEILLDTGLITKSQLERARKTRPGTDKESSPTLIEQGP